MTHHPILLTIYGLAALASLGFFWTTQDEVLAKGTPRLHRLIAVRALLVTMALAWPATWAVLIGAAVSNVLRKGKT